MEQHKEGEECHSRAKKRINVVDAVEELRGTIRDGFVLLAKMMGERNRVLWPGEIVDEYEETHQ